MHLLANYFDMKGIIDTIENQAETNAKTDELSHYYYYHSSIILSMLHCRLAAKI